MQQYIEKVWCENHQQVMSRSDSGSYTIDVMLPQHLLPYIHRSFIYVNITLIKNFTNRFFSWTKHGKQQLKSLHHLSDANLVLVFISRRRALSSFHCGNQKLQDNNSGGGKMIIVSMKKTRKAYQDLEHQHVHMPQQFAYSIESWNYHGCEGWIAAAARKHFCMSVIYPSSTKGCSKGKK